MPDEPKGCRVRWFLSANTHISQHILEYARTWGDPESPTVVCLPGAGGTQWLWTPHAELLVDEYRIVAVDMPAHGAHPVSSFDFDRAISDIGEVLDEEGPATLVAHSLGGRVAMEAGLAHEARVDGLLLAGVSDSSGLFGEIRQLLFSYGLELATHSTSVRAWIEEQYGLEDERQVPPDDIDTYDAAIAAARGIRGALFRDSLAALEQYDGPILLTYGEDETDDASANELADQVGGQLRWYEGGHGVPSRSPRVFTDIVGDSVETVYGD